MKLLKCPLCKGSKYHSLFVVNNFEHVKCLNCSFVYVTNTPSVKAQQEYYSNKDYMDPLTAEKIIRIDAIRSLKIIEKYSLNRDLIDMGCGRGYFLSEAVKRGWRVKGIDYSSDVIKYASKVLHLNVSQGNLLTYKFNRQYDVVCLNQVIEHVSDPIDLIKIMKNTIKDKGYIYIATPNIESLSSKMYKNNFDYIIPPEHLSYFSEKTLVYLLENLNFKVVYTGTWSYSPEFAGIIKYFIKNIMGEANNHSDITLTKPYNNVDDIKSKNYILLSKKMKKKLFDDVFCKYFHSVLDIFSYGSMVHIIAQKV